jgi:agmatine deiminase
MAKTINSTPYKDGFRMPAEFEPHQGCWMLWPERPDNWRLGAKPAQEVFADVASAIAQFEKVTIGVSKSQFEHARAVLPEKIRIVECSYNDSWMRDCGPSFVKNDKGDVRLVDWDFNAWGGLYDGLYFPWDQDDLIPRKISEIEDIDRYKGPMVLEGGSFNVDGQGTLITTEECLLSPGRNPHLTKAEIEENLRQYLGAEKVIWLPKGLDPEETNGHVDDVCCFVRPGVVLMHWVDDPNHAHYQIVRDAYKVLSETTDARGRTLEIHKLLAPERVVITKEESQGVDVCEGTIPRQEGDIMEPSYINFYIANGGIIVPSFNDANDKNAVEVLQKVFPERKVVSIKNAREILLGGGNVHCITQQQPKP